MLTTIQKRTGQAGSAPLSFGQRGLWFLHHLNPESYAYNTYKAWRVTGRLNEDKLRQAIDALVLRHEPLRTRIVLIDGEPRQVVDSVPTPAFARADFRSEPRQTLAQRCRQAMLDAVREPLNLEKGPVFRVKLIRTAADTHILSFITHHAFIDGWSIGVLVRDFGELFNACVGARAPNLPELTVSYGDFADWQRNSAAAASQTALDYWRDQLADAPELLDLPTDKQRPPIAGHRGQRLVFEISLPQTRQLKILARSARATLFMVLLAAFKILLYRFSGQTDISVGTPFANRSKASTENLVGLFANTLVIRSRLDGNPAFNEMLARVRSSLSEAFNHASTPVDQIVESLQIPRDLGHNPLFQVMFAFQNVPKHELALDGLKIDAYELAEPRSSQQGIGAAKFDLNLTITEHAEGMACSFEYRTDLFVEATVRHLQQAFRTLIGSILDNPGQSINEARLLGPAERRSIISRWNKTDGECHADDTLQLRFSRQVEKSPNAIALQHASESIDFHELDRLSAQIAAVLVEHGFSHGDVAGILMPPSIMRVAALLGVLKSGGIFVPLDDDFPAARLALMSKKAGARIVLTSPNSTQGDLGPTVEIIELLGGTSLGNAPLPAAGSLPTAGPDVAYVMFTSGSTGVPKAVAGTHRGAVNRTDWLQNSFPYGAEDICCQRINPGFVDAIAETFAPLLAGAPTRILSDEERADPASLIDSLHRYRVSRITLTPVLLRSMLASRSGIAQLACLKIWICSGETLTADLCQRFYAQLPGATLLNLYGCTEVAADATWFDCRNFELGRRVPIGRPIDNMKTYILDQSMQPAPVAFAGDLYVAGTGVAAGYWQRPELTEQRFLANPFDGGDSVIYKTGDIARYREDGHIEHLGRADRQIKFHGIRIEAEEIESLLASHVDVSEAIVDVWEDKHFQQFLVAWFVPAGGQPPAPQVLRQHLKHLLPQQWVPSFFVALNALPLLPNGKIDRRSLPAPPTQQSDTENSTTPPTNDVERKLAGIWENLLHRENVGIDDDFFDLGGHSLLTFELLQRIEDEFGTRLQIATIFLSPTITELADHLRQQPDHSAKPNILIEIRARSDAATLFCVPAAATTILSLAAIPTKFEDTQSFVGIESHGFAPGTEPQDSVESMAATYIDAIRKYQTIGPYFLAGRCFGGVVAFEMARQLIQNGQKVGLLALLETAVPVSNMKKIIKSLRLFDRLRFLSLYPLDRFLARGLNNALADEFTNNLAASPESIKKKMLKIDACHRRALKAYTPAPLDAPVAVFRSRQGFWSCRIGWDLFTLRTYRCNDMSGDRNTMFDRPHVLELSRTLSELLRTAAAGLD